MSIKSDNGKVVAAAKAAFPRTIPVMAGYWFLGITYGMLMKTNGFSFLFPVLMAFTIYGGSLEFVAVQMLMGTFAPFQTLLMTLLIQARHLFYGLTMLEKYKGVGLKKFYLIYGLSDETFAVNSSSEIPEGIDKGWFYATVTFLDRFYWISGAAAGWLFGALIKFNLTGLDFCMTAMFVVIYLDQWFKEKHHDSALIGVGASALALVIFGPDSFMIPAMCLILILLTVARHLLEERYAPVQLAASSGNEAVRIATKDFADREPGIGDKGGGSL